MRRELLELACCPACEFALSLAEGRWSDDELRTGSLECERCGRRYRIADGLPLLYVDDDRWTPNAREALGWVELHKSLGIYDQTGVEIDFKLPYFPEDPWLKVAQHFEAGLELAELTGEETVLDMGAGRGWAAKHFAARGCRVVAIDVVPDDQVGLGRSLAIMEEAGVRFDPVIGDNERLPFYTETFDLVFCAAVLHHAKNLDALLRSAARVLKRGGRLVAVNEPCLGVSDDESEVLERDAAQELEFGILETRPRLNDYWRAMERAGFEDIELEPFQAHSMTLEQLEDWSAALVQSSTGGSRLSRWRRWWEERRATWALPSPRSRRDALIRTALLHASHDIVICARKPGRAPAL